MRLTRTLGDVRADIEAYAERIATNVEDGTAALRGVALVVGGVAVIALVVAVIALVKADRPNV